MMRLNIAPAPWSGAPVVVLSAGLGGGGGYWLAQRAALEEQYQLVSYDHNGTGENAGPLPAGYSLATMAGELFSALQAAGIARFALVGHALGALIGLQLALDRPEAVSALALVNGWLSLSPHTRRCFQVRERLLHAGGAQAWVEAQLQAVWDLMKMGPTSANCSPARIVFVRSAEGKEKLRPTLSSGNLQKTMQAPVTAIVAWDSAFYDRLPTLFPHGDARSWFTSSPQLAEETAFRNSSLQAAYLIFACRALDLDTGPMSGFDREKVDAAFFADNGWKSNLLVNIGYGDPGKLYGRLPRLSFDEACLLA